MLEDMAVKSKLEKAVDMNLDKSEVGVDLAGLGVTTHSSTVGAVPPETSGQQENSNEVGAGGVADKDEPEAGKTETENKFNEETTKKAKDLTPNIDLNGAHVATGDIGNLVKTDSVDEDNEHVLAIL